MGLFDRVFSWACHRVFKRVDVDGSGTIEGLEIEVSMLTCQCSLQTVLLSLKAVWYQPVHCCVCRSQYFTCVSVAGGISFPMQHCLQIAVLPLVPGIASWLSSCCAADNMWNKRLPSWQNPPSRQQIRAAFDIFDVDRSGTLDHRVLCMLSPAFPGANLA